MHLSFFEPRPAQSTMEAIIKAIDALPRSIKIFVGAMMGLQALAIGSWLIMMLRESRSNEKEKQS
jgi:hypothetical protein